MLLFQLLIPVLAALTIDGRRTHKLREVRKAQQSSVYYPAVNIRESRGTIIRHPHLIRSIYQRLQRSGIR